MCTKLCVELLKGSRSHLASSQVRTWGLRRERGLSEAPTSVGPQLSWFLVASFPSTLTGTFFWARLTWAPNPGVGIGLASFSRL
jgi:hypothetical protein